jgi:hypothetical protein
MKGTAFFAKNQQLNFSLVSPMSLSSQQKSILAGLV